MSTRTKLLLAQTPLVIAVVLLGLVATRALSRLAEHGNRILTDNYRSILAAERMKDALEHLQEAAALLLLQGPTAKLDGAQAERRRFETELRVQEQNITEIGEAEATHKLRELWDGYQQSFDRTVNGPGSPPSPDARKIFLEELVPSAAAIRGAADRVLVLNHDAMTRKSEEAREAAERLNVLLSAVAVVALLGGTLLSLVITNRLLQPLGLLTRAVQRIGEGDFDARITLAGTDELAQLAEHVNGMAARLKQYRRSSLGELLLAQQASQAAIDGLPDPVIVFDAHGGVLNANRAAETLLGLTIEGAPEGGPLRLLEPSLRATLEIARDHVLAGKGAYTPRGFDEAVAVRGAEESRYLLPRATPVYAEEGDVAGATVTLQDVTRLRRVDELRSDLVATLARELCTPLASLHMGIHLCIEQAAGPLTERQADLLYACRDDCDRLQATVDELLHLARIQGAQIELDRQPTPAGTLVEPVIDAQRPLAAKRYVQLDWEPSTGLHDLSVDRERVRSVVASLLTKAIHRSPAGSAVTVRVHPVHGTARFEITDSGTPIPLDQRSTIFERFAEPQGTTAVHGLSFAKEIIDAHGGRIGIEATADGKTTFWFTLPAIGGNETSSSSL
ncbi:MAG TPA: ATP-binding protein [Candidatus Binatia bacterium]